MAKAAVGDGVFDMFHFSVTAVIDPNTASQQKKKATSAFPTFVLWMLASLFLQQQTQVRWACQMDQLYY